MNRVCNWLQLMILRYLLGISFMLILHITITPILSFAQVNRAAPPITQDITVDEKLGDILDLSQSFLTSKGDTITLADLADPQKPVLLNPLYYDCPILCNLVLDRVADGIAALDWTPGKEFTIVSFSIDSHRNTRRRTKSDGASN